MLRALAQHWTARLAALPAALLGLVLSLFASAAPPLLLAEAPRVSGSSRVSEPVTFELGSPAARRTAVPTVASLARACAAALAAARPLARRPTPLPALRERVHTALVRDGVLLPILR